MNMNALYPVVVDLSDSEYAPQGFCCSQFLCSGGVEFSLNDLVSPEQMPITYEDDRRELVRSQSNAMRRSRSQGLSLASTPLTQAQFETRNEYDDAVFDHRRMTFNDLYVLTRLIHKGLRSVIWECVHRATGQRYAVKIVDRRNLNKNKEKAVYREIHMLDIIDPNTPGTIHLHQYFDEFTHLYIITEYIPGGNLLARIIRKKNISEAETKVVIRSMLECLVSHHRNGTVHRNLKPDNILLDGLSAIIADYGLAAQLMYDDTGQMVLFTSRCGTSAYVAPEILNKQPYASQVDMWGVGIIAYMCLAGYPPFADNSKQVLFEMISKGAYTFDPKDWAKVSRSAKRFISSLLHVDPSVRMTAEEALHHPWLAVKIPAPPVVEEVIAPPPPPLDTISPKTSPTNKLRRALSNLLGGKKDYGIEKAGDDGSMTSYNTSNMSTDNPGQR